MSMMYADYFFIHIASIAAAYLLDLAFGDPYSLPHPVRYIGRFARFFEMVLRRDGDSRRRELALGLVFTVVVVGSTFAVVASLTAIAIAAGKAVFFIVNTYILYTSFAARCLGDEAKKVEKALGTLDIERSRKQISMLVARDTSSLDENGIIRATVETVAENTVDGEISPLFYAILGAPFGLSAPFSYIFKAASTLDSMVGYRNEKYENFGKASARLDDLLNFIPARISGILIPLSALISGMDAVGSFRIMARDRLNHKSPNCGYPESAFAGALGIMVGGTNVYFGKEVYKPTIGDAKRALRTSDIGKSVRLMHVSSMMACAFFILCALALKLYWR